MSIVPTFGQKRPGTSVNNFRGNVGAPALSPPAPRSPPPKQGEAPPRSPLTTVITRLITEVRPHITVSIKKTMSASEWDTNTFLRGTTELDPSTLSPLELGHIYSVRYDKAAGSWLVSAPRAVDEESAWLFEGLGVETNDADIRLRWPGQASNPRLYGDVVRIPEESLNEFKERVEALEGLYIQLTPRQDETAKAAQELVRQFVEFRQGAADREQGVRARIQGMNADNWSDVSAAIEAELVDENRQEEKFLLLRNGIADAIPTKDNEKTASHWMAEALLAQITQPKDGLRPVMCGTLRSELRAAVVSIAQNGTVAAVDPAEQLKKLATTIDGLGALARLSRDGLCTDPTYTLRVDMDGDSGTLVFTGNIVTFQLPRAALDRIIRQQAEELAARQLREAQEKGGGRYDV